MMEQISYILDDQKCTRTRHDIGYDCAPVARGVLVELSDIDGDALTILGRAVAQS